MINNKTEKSMMYDYLICLAALVFMSIYYYGWRAIIVTGISAITCYLVDIFCRITSYNVCYTKLLRSNKIRAMQIIKRKK